MWHMIHSVSVKGIDSISEFLSARGSDQHL